MFVLNLEAKKHRLLKKTSVFFNSMSFYKNHGFFCCLDEAGGHMSPDSSVVAESHHPELYIYFFKIFITHLISLDSRR